MTESEIRDVIDEAINTVEFVPPISHVYCGKLRDAIRAHVPSASIEVLLRDAALIIDVRTQSASCVVRQPL